MKKNTVLYVLLIVLIIMNGFFLFNYLGRPQHKGVKESSAFIVKELNFDASQLEKFKQLEENHHFTMQKIGDGIKVNKDKLFTKITAPTIDRNKVDSLIIEISKADLLKEKELFNKLRGIYEICDENQKKRFSDILKKARRFNGNGPEGSGRGERPERP
ncbi:hypothetical protein [Lacinutrix venerupis]|uniref:LTXXQ motif family protein n=1 Tax=Lacinutrix venerupis TaxID=1486034 RepID=A0AAC9LJI6_9FLAO|nr:hypothetical protein [Lacinutrix venerupis]APX99805.1 hypothetical protein BWR22_05600 [Lacinutrix venerupis]